MRESTDTNVLGGRLDLLSPDDLEAAQRQVYDALTRLVVPEAEFGEFTAQTGDGRFVGPFNALLRVPDIAAGMGQWTAAIARAGLADDVRHVIVLTVGAHWRAEYEIKAHRRAAVKSGVPLHAVEDIIAGRTPQGLADPVLVAYQLTTALLGEHAVSDGQYHNALETFGESGLVAVLCFIGQYQVISSVLVTFDVPVPQESDAPRDGANLNGGGGSR